MDDLLAYFEQEMQEREAEMERLADEIERLYWLKNELLNMELYVKLGRDTIRIQAGL